MIIGSIHSLQILDRGYYSLRPPLSQTMSSVSELLAVAERKLQNGIQDIGQIGTTLASQTRYSNHTHNHVAPKSDPQ